MSLDLQFAQVVAGSRWRHIKRGGEYTILGLTRAIPSWIGDNSTGTVVLDDEVVSVIFQRSTTKPSDFWAVYENAELTRFARPVSEFTADRFERIPT